jgi:hypothetical protein
VLEHDACKDWSTYIYGLYLALLAHCLSQFLPRSSIHMQVLWQISIWFPCILLNLSRRLANIYMSLVGLQGRATN